MENIEDNVMQKTIEIDNIICIACKGKKVVLVENIISVCPNCKGSGKAYSEELAENKSSRKKLIFG